jgi:hypothetical protein
MSRAKFKGKLPLKIASVSRPQIDDLLLKYCIPGGNPKNKTSGRNSFSLEKTCHRTLISKNEMREHEGMLNNKDYE